LPAAATIHLAARYLVRKISHRFSALNVVWVFGEVDFNRMGNFWQTIDELDQADTREQYGQK
jgi:hypothetical protein